MSRFGGVEEAAMKRAIENAGYEDHNTASFAKQL
jgi:hypothetical protein